jgi:hypothetical protein
MVEFTVMDLYFDEVSSLNSELETNKRILEVLEIFWERNNTNTS